MNYRKKIIKEADKEREKITNEGLYRIIYKWFKESKSLESEEVKIEYILKLMDEAEEYIKPLEALYREELFYKFGGYDLITCRQSACMVKLITAASSKMYKDMIINLKYDELGKRVEYNQYVLYKMAI